MRRAVTGTDAAVDDQPSARCLACEVDRSFCHLALGQSTVLRDPFYGVSVAVAGRKIHACIDLVGILFERLLDQAHRLDEFTPVHCAQKAQAGDAVAD